MKRVFRDPLTGDQQGLYEHVSWLIQQHVLRRPAFLVAWTALTAYWWHAQGIPFLVSDPDLSRWNLVASYLAICIEAIVGLAMFAQTRRDALILRELRTLVRRLERTERQELDILEGIGEALEVETEPD